MIRKRGNRISEGKLFGDKAAAAPQRMGARRESVIAIQNIRREISARAPVSQAKPLVEPTGP